MRPALFVVIRESLFQIADDSGRKRRMALKERHVGFMIFDSTSWQMGDRTAGFSQQFRFTSSIAPASSQTSTFPKMIDLLSALASALQ